MTVLMSKYRRAQIMGSLLCRDLDIYIYKGAMPTKITSTLSVFLTSYQSSLLGRYGPYNASTNTIELEAENTDLNNLGWYMVETTGDLLAEGTGTAAWFMTSPVSIASYRGDYEFWVCDSISLPGGNGVLQLASLTYTAGVIMPRITDFAIKL